MWKPHWNWVSLLLIYSHLITNICSTFHRLPWCLILLGMSGDIRPKVSLAKLRGFLIDAFVRLFSGWAVWGRISHLSWVGEKKKNITKQNIHTLNIYHYRFDKCPNIITSSDIPDGERQQPPLKQRHRTHTEWPHRLLEDWLEDCRRRGRLTGGKWGCWKRVCPGGCASALRRSYSARLLWAEMPAACWKMQRRRQGCTQSEAKKIHVTGELGLKSMSNLNPLPDHIT